MTRRSTNQILLVALLMLLLLRRGRGRSGSGGGGGAKWILVVGSFVVATTISSVSSTETSPLLLRRPTSFLFTRRFNIATVAAVTTSTAATNHHNTIKPLLLQHPSLIFTKDNTLIMDEGIVNNDDNNNDTNTTQNNNNNNNTNDMVDLHVVCVSSSGSTSNDDDSDDKNNDNDNNNNNNGHHQGEDDDTNTGSIVSDVVTTTSAVSYVTSIDRGGDSIGWKKTEQGNVNTTPSAVTRTTTKKKQEVKKNWLSCKKVTSTTMTSSSIWPYFGLYYLLNYGFFKSTTGVLLEYWYPWTLGVLQMGVPGLVTIGPLWIFRRRPFSSCTISCCWRNVKLMLCLAVMSSLLHMASIVCLGCGGVGSLIQNVRGLEPIITTIISLIVVVVAGTTANTSTDHQPQSHFLQPSVMISLLLLTIGVIIANTPDVWKITTATTTTAATTTTTFSTTIRNNTKTYRALVSALVGTIASACRVLLAKKMMAMTDLKDGGSDNSNNKAGGYSSCRLDAHNIYTISSIMAMFIMLPIALSIEGLGFFRDIHRSIAQHTTTEGGGGGIIPSTILQHAVAMRQVITSSFFYYWFNDIGFMILDKVNHPISFVVGTAIKRPVMVFWSRVAYNRPLYHRGELVGGMLAIVSACWYAQSMKKANVDMNVANNVKPSTSTIKHQPVEHQKEIEMYRLRFQETVMVLLGLGLVAIVTGW
jgi:Triose-phosphate Transporter family